MEIQLLVIIVLVIIVILYFNSKRAEHYDAKVVYTTQRQCGDLCTAGVGCYGYAYKDNGNCYLANNYILGKPAESLYSDEYSLADFRCNKFRAIQGLSDSIVPEALKQNAFYACSDGEEGEYTLQLTADTVYKPLTDFSDIEKIVVPPYQLFDIIWPTKKSQVINMQDVVGNKGNDNKQTYTVYERSQDEYLGPYVFPHRCSANISEQACLEVCTQYDNCVGVEFNPYYVKYDTDATDVYHVFQNVCCPKSRIDNVIPRRAEFKNGKFYLKTNRSNLNKSKIYTTDTTVKL